jgi:AAA+ superfamily predicted ATPase
MSSTDQAIAKLDRHLRSRTPVVYIVSHEESRVLQAVTAMAVRPVTALSGEALLPEGYRVFIWTFTRGIRPADPDAANPFDPYGTRDPAEALAAFGQHAQADGTPAGMTDNAAILIALDLHRFLADTHDPLPVRALRDLAADLKPTRSACAIIAPALCELGDAEKQVAVLDWPLPDREELTALIADIADRLPAHIPQALNGDTEAIARAMAGLTYDEASQALLAAVVATGELAAATATPHILDAKREAVRRSGALEYIAEQATASDIGGLDLLKAEASGLPRLFTAEAGAAHAAPPRGMLLVGVPGTGKSLAAKATAGGNMPLLRFDLGAAMGSLLGQSEAQVRQAIKIAEAVAPCVLWIDEIEKALGSGGGETDGGTSQRVLGALLTWMQERTAPVLVVATANDITALRPELVRRFDSRWWVDLPGPAACAEILGIHARKGGLRLAAESLDILGRQAARRELSGAEIEQAVQRCLNAAFLNGGRVGTDDLAGAIGAVVPVARTMDAEIKALREWAIGRAMPASSPEAAPARGASPATLAI